MSATRSFTFLWTPWSATTSLLVIAGMAVVCLYAWRKSGYRRGIGLLELLRLAIVALIALIFIADEGNPT